jgi:high-affinity K+ transport system ATPase subunit B
MANRIVEDMRVGVESVTTEQVPAPSLRKDDVVLVRAGEFIPEMERSSKASLRSTESAIHR